MRLADLSECHTFMGVLQTSKQFYSTLVEFQLLRNVASPTLSLLLRNCEGTVRVSILSTAHTSQMNAFAREIPCEGTRYSHHQHKPLYGPGSIPSTTTSSRRPAQYLFVRTGSSYMMLIPQSDSHNDGYYSELGLNRPIGCLPTGGGDGRTVS